MNTPYYLKCNQCGHFNEVKSEYLIFCSKCNKKLDVNYHDWINRNSDKTFEEYKQLVCTTESSDASTVKTPTKKRLSIKYWIGFTITFTIFAITSHLVGPKIIQYIYKPAFNKVLMQTASEINKSCPIMVDNATRLDNTIVLPNDIFQYNYTITAYEKDSLNVDQLKKEMEPSILNNVKTNPDLKVFRDNDITMKYYYKDKNGVYLFTISITPSKYKE